MLTIMEDIINNNVVYDKLLQRECKISLSACLYRAELVYYSFSQLKLLWHIRCDVWCLKCRSVAVEVNGTPIQGSKWYWHRLHAIIMFQCWNGHWGCTRMATCYCPTLMMHVGVTTTCGQNFGYNSMLFALWSFVHTKSFQRPFVPV